MWLQNSTLFYHIVVWWRIGRPLYGTTMHTFAKSLQFVKYNLKRWNRQCFGNIFLEKVVAQEELNRITRLIRDNGVSKDLFREEARTLKVVEEWELCEEVYWKQKERVDWLQEGDKNIAFFFNSMKAKRQGNSISVLINGRGDRLVSFHEIVVEVSQYFVALFREDAQGGLVEEAQVLSCIPQLVSKEANEYLMREISLEELKVLCFRLREGNLQALMVSR